MNPTKQMESQFSMQDAMQEASASFAAAAAEQQNVIVQSSVAGRSVVDYENPEDLRAALEERMEVAGHACAEPPMGKSDWLLPVPDPDAEPQTVLTEMQRLLTLKSYLLLDAAKEEAFDQLTREACALYNVPTSLISLVDLGRQFLLSNTGIEDGTRETPRTAAFCSHTILSKQGICVVPDTTQDPRFRNNCLVTDGPKLRFYAGAPLISPEGYKLGTFCVEGPDPRPEGLTREEQEKLKEFAAKAMHLMVERRSVMQRAHLAGNLLANVHMRRHAAVTTNLGALIYQHYFNESVTAMKLFQESVQTLMHIEDEHQTAAAGSASAASSSEQADQPPFLTPERQDELYALLELMKAAESREQMDEVLEKTHLQFPNDVVTTATLLPNVAAENIPRANNVPGVFLLSSKLKGSQSQVRVQGLTFNEAFEVSLLVAKAFDPADPHSNLDDRSFIIPLNQCSKATLFNMGLIHYQWGSADIAMQYFDLAASLSQTNDPTHFDPVVLGCLNNMAQINLQYGRSADATELLSDALTRGNAALTTIYGHGSDDISCSSTESNGVMETKEEIDHQNLNDRRRTLRLRRKLARTLLNIAHVHFFKCDYDPTMTTLVDAFRLLHTDMELIEVAAIWYNMALVHYYQGSKQEALENVNKFLNLAQKLITTSPNHIQIADALHQKGKILFEMGNSQESMTMLNEALKLRRELLGETDPAVAESMCMIGKVLLQREEYDVALNAFEMGLAVQRQTLAAKVGGGDDQVLSFEVAQTLLEIGRVYHAKHNLNQALASYLEVGHLTRNFFGDRHPFVARIDTIVGNLYMDMGSTEKAQSYFDEAKAISEDNNTIVK
jgi:tetratricopeptide (TPR) repeat protein